MTNSEARPHTPTVNAEKIPEIQEWENKDIRDLLAENGLAEDGFVITPEDYEATKDRAEVLAQTIKVPASLEALILTAFVDRMRNAERIGDDVLKRMPDEALRSVIYVDTGLKPSDEELQQLRATPLSFQEWERGRVIAREGVPTDVHVAVNKEDSVVGRGESPEEALRRAKEEEKS